MTSEQIIQELERYRSELTGIMGRFVDSTRAYRITKEDDPRYRTFIIEIIDFLNDSFSKNQYSSAIDIKFNQGIYNELQTPSYKSIEDIVSIIDSVITRLKRNPDFYIKKEEPTRQDGPTKIELPPPEKVTLKWLWEYVPHSLWALLGGLLLSSFGLGVKFAETNLYKSLTNPASPSVNSAIQNSRSSAVKNK
ncbi:MAG: hypothetical protein HXX11_21395 [Desulfuromonadales bacterium]|nr:hypothetical protein [Desulfuromonadales bacterium]